ncbi:MAG: FkbM family methyltransferase [Chitinophagales bacterium]|nr:FkbM family methyltransferase [Chitinophagales bacterium]
MATLKTKARELLIDLSGYWIYKKKDIPIGCDLSNDLKNKISLPLKTVFDVGANIGQTSIKFRESFPAAAIYAFEPVKKTFRELTDNTKGLTRVQCFNVALGEKAESVEIDVFEGDASVFNSLKKEAQNTTGNAKETISVTTGDLFCKEYRIPEIDLLKIDTEGYEIQVLQGFRNMIATSKIKAIFCEVGFTPANTRNTYINDLIDFASKHNFKFYGVYEVSNLQIKAGNNYGNVLFLNNEVVKNLR